MRIFAYIWMFFFMGIPAVLMVVGVSMITTQQDRLARYLPVPAVIVESEVRTSRGSKGSTNYHADIRYAYEVNGYKLSATQLNAAGVTESGHDWAHGLVTAYPVGMKTTAWYDPAAPEEAFLQRYTAFDPYVFVLFPMLFIYIGAMAGVAMLRSGIKAKPPVALPEGGFELSPHRPIGSRLRTALFHTALWWSVGLAAVGHYLSVSDAASSGAMILSGIYFAVGLFPLCSLIYFFLLSRTVAEPRVSVDTDRFRQGETFHVLVEQPVKMHVKVDALEVALICTEHRKTTSGSKTSYSSHRMHEQKFNVLEKDVEAPDGQPLSGLQKITIPPHLPVSSSTGYPRHDWHLSVVTKITGRPDYRGIFAIQVEPRGAK